MLRIANWLSTVGVTGPTRFRLVICVVDVAMIVGVRRLSRVTMFRKAVAGVPFVLVIGKDQHPPRQ